MTEDSAGKPAERKAADDEFALKFAKWFAQGYQNLPELEETEAAIHWHADRRSTEDHPTP